MKNNSKYKINLLFKKKWRLIIEKKALADDMRSKSCCTLKKKIN